MHAQGLVLAEPENDATLPKLVDALRLANEEDVELVAVGIRVQEICEGTVDLVRLFGNVDGSMLLHILDNLVERINLLLGRLSDLYKVDLAALELVYQLQAHSLGIVDLLLKLDYFVGHFLIIFLHLVPRAAELLDFQVHLLYGCLHVSDCLLVLRYQAVFCAD